MDKLILILFLLFLASCSVVHSPRQYYLMIDNCTDVKIELLVEADHRDKFKQDTSPSTTATIPLAPGM